MANTEVSVKVPVADPAATGRQVAAELLGAMGLPLERCASAIITMKPGEPAYVDVRYRVSGTAAKAFSEIVHRYQFIEPGDIYEGDEG